ncbi:hypothetical protein T484DRAFT_3352049 [Baffinella frigidus]|nr:hypothetical protein T484DRAFT_3352049 [Cryptophyta sp. CCMP2293]
MWAQDKIEVHLTVFVPDGTKARDVHLNITKSRISVTVTDLTILSRDLAHMILEDEEALEGAWEVKTIGGQRALQLTLQKSTEGIVFNTSCDVIWWGRVFVGDPPIDEASLDRRYTTMAEAASATRLPCAVPALPAEGIVSLATLSPSSEPPSELLHIHLIDLLYAYSCTFRAYGGRPLSAVRNSAATLLRLSAVLRLKAGEGEALSSLPAVLQDSRQVLLETLPFLASQIHPLHLQALRDTERMAVDKKSTLHALAGVHALLDEASKLEMEDLQAREDLARTGANPGTFAIRPGEGTMLPDLGVDVQHDDDAWAKPMNLAPDWNCEDPEEDDSCNLQDATALMKRGVGVGLEKGVEVGGAGGVSEAEVKVVRLENAALKALFFMSWRGELPDSALLKEAGLVRAIRNEEAAMEKLAPFKMDADGNPPVPDLDDIKGQKFEFDPNFDPGFSDEKEFDDAEPIGDAPGGPLKKFAALSDSEEGEGEGVGGKAAEYEGVETGIEGDPGGRKKTSRQSRPAGAEDSDVSEQRYDPHFERPDPAEGAQQMGYIDEDGELVIVDPNDQATFLPRESRQAQEEPEAFPGERDAMAGRLDRLGREFQNN